MQAIEIPPHELDSRCEQLRLEVREFLAETLADSTPAERAPNWSAYSPEFSRRLGARGWIGVTWPKHYGGAERSGLERYVLMEELLAAGAPVSYHWVAERQSTPLLMRHAPALAAQIAPRVARGECCFAIGMSEPGSGSDLASVRTRAVPRDGGWSLEGSKIWTSAAHLAHYMIALVRTDDRGESRHAGLSQFLVPMSTPGITVRPIVNLLGEHHFNEVFFDDVRLPADHLIGAAGEGWKQVTEELAFERSGPERYLSSTQLLVEMLKVASPDDPRHAVELGRLVAGYGALRQMSLGVSALLAAGRNPALAAAVVKELGSNLEHAVPDVAHELFGGRAGLPDDFTAVRDYVTRAAPSFSLRGGTREILRGIIAKGLDLR